VVGLVLVSHSFKLAEGVKDLVEQMAQGRVRIIAAGGTLDGRLGTDATLVASAVQMADDSDGVVALMDLGSAVLSAETDLELLPSEIRDRVRLCDAPFVEGAVAAGVEASLGSSLEQVCRAAAEARQMSKLLG
jgi:phosphoenolpyruvate---glycerone phosphotransferase subunit DhaM